MNLLLLLVVCTCWTVSLRCSADQTAAWPPDMLEDKGFHNMLLTSDGKHLIISGLNGVYNLNTTNFQLLNQAVTGPLNDGTDDVIKIMIYNRTEADTNTFITTCSSTRDYCDIREVNDISRSVNQLEPPIKIDGVDAVMATYLKKSGNNRREDFLFVGCPHVEGQENLNGRCTKPGIAWYLDSGNDKGSPWYGFKSYEDTPVLTEKYIDAFNVDKYKFFFSLQRVKSSNTSRSRLAQVCQYFVQRDNKYSTPLTYADMPIQCGQLKKMQSVKKFVFENETLFIAVFSESLSSSKFPKSTLCVYTLAEIKRKFVDNIKDCYRGGRAPENEDYIKLLTPTKPCTTAVTDNTFFSKPEDFFLCNTENYDTFQQVVGTRVLHTMPVVEYDKQLTAVTVSAVDSKIVAFLGTTTGEILKAVVYPRTSAGRVKQARIRNTGYPIKQDMYTSEDEKHIFVLSERQVYKESVESCSDFSTCADCLGSRDPYCGWCFLEKRCGTRNTCKTTNEWISVSSNEKCPHVANITPKVMSDKEITMLSIEVSHALEGVRVSCAFHSDEVGGDFNHTVPATLSQEGKTLNCMPTKILEIEDKIKGYLDVTVAILANDSDISVRGSFIIYRCETFERCIDCTAANWTCKWCTYSNQCINNDRSCGENDIEVEVDKCPRVTSYSIVSDERHTLEFNGTVYLSRDSNYEINITGTNLPVPRYVPQSVSYKCRINVSGRHILWFNTTVFDEGGSLTCEINKEMMATIPGPVDRLKATVQVTWGISPIYGDTMPVIIYACQNVVKPSNNCGLCKSFALYQPHLHCQWCGNECISSGIACNTTESECGDPEITKVYPLSAHVNATTLVEIEGVNLGSVYNDTVTAVTIAGIPCASVENKFDPGLKIVCELSPSYTERKGLVVVTLSNNATGKYDAPFYFRVPGVTHTEPSFGPLSGGTSVTIYGEYLNTGNEKRIAIGGNFCRVNIPEARGDKLECITSSGNSSQLNQQLDIKVDFDGANVMLNENITYTYVEDPEITEISPTKSFKSGGRTLTVKGTNLNSIQKPKIYSVIGGLRMKSEDCRRDDMAGVIYCPSPRYTGTNYRRRKRSSDPVQANLGFEMDDVSSVTAENLPSNLAVLLYYPDPILENFTEVKVYQELQEHLVIKGKGLKMAANEDDVVIKIDCENCNVTSMSNEAIICEPPRKKPACDQIKDRKLIVTVNIGFLKRNVGIMQYDPSVTPPDEATEKVYYIAGGIVGFLVLCLLVSAIVLFVMWKKRKHMKKEKKGLEYKMDKLEAKFRNQCREEFAALQTAVSDLTSDLEGGNVLFRDYDVYASKTLFTSQKSDPLMTPPTVTTEQSQQAMDTFKGILRNRQFLLMLIKTLEKQQSFSIHDKSNVATILMVLNHDNMEYITGILTTLLDDLIDKNITSQTPKLLLRRSECVAEKLLTHWLSICLYHFLKEHSGSALYILYKAIKIQTEKGPIDYISNCGKYTLSEDKIFTSADTEINPVSLTLDVKHFDLIDNKEKQICVQVLDCDTITQAKSKMLEILYKNVPYSQRPSVHSVSLEIEEGDGGSKRLLNDEDASSVKEGLWKRINTLQHYNINDGAKVILCLNRELEASCTSLVSGAPDSFIVGSFRRSKPVVRTISGSNFWHLTKKHQTDGEVQLGSDLFLPRLLNTKGTLQVYIDDLFQAVLSVGEEPPIIIKYLFDFLDSSASRCGIKDPDVLHTWKCNSLLLRFWVNIIKNPEFVFDIHKPLIVDSCLSVVAQTLMDSCSTADLVLGSSSPSNKLLFAKDIPRYKSLVRQYFEDMKQAPAVSDQDLNSYLTQKVSQKFSGRFHQASALIEMYKYTAKYREEICKEMDNLEASSPGSFSPLSSKLEYIFMSMDMYK